MPRPALHVALRRAVESLVVFPPQRADNTARYPRGKDRRPGGPTRPRRTITAAGAAKAFWSIEGTASPSEPIMADALPCLASSPSSEVASRVNPIRPPTGPRSCQIIAQPDPRCHLLAGWRIVG